ncbi:EmrB/QacA subfamily drug resistance transporter [Streptomyces zagrosensis]|uniref:EmrB/QacA subfamily drug resistance transporter n=2 Tax=Streptomyces zagrosensis TaxID=1042984 RepID=A0A7W9Q4V8_9ACTN|nr:MFS transporter [Streptomyces zagrosensis]MBB5933253.1 EmrB/QacA subfamily drug resistance transporter [Streptomyces zagrosensis]
MSQTDAGGPAAVEVPAPAASRPTPLAWAVIVAACAGQFLVVLDVSVVNVALPSMRTGLGLGENDLQWVANAYTLTYAGFMLLGGRAGDLFGRKQVFLVGLGLFTAASLAGGLAQEPWQVIAARAVQGIGAATLAPSTLTIITSSFPEGPERVRAIGLWMAVGIGGGAAGGLIGGVLTDYLSWRWVLLINVPIGVLVFVIAASALTGKHAIASRRPLDLPGAVLVTCGVGAVAYGIAQTEAHGWGAADAAVPLIGGLLALAAFVVVESRTPEPLIPLRLFRVRSVWSANLVLLVCGIGFFAMWYFLSLYMQNVLDYSAVRTGLAFLPHTISIIVGAQLAPKLMARGVDPRLLTLAGGVVATVGFGWQSTMDVDGTFLSTIIGPGILMSFGAGLMMTPLTAAATSGVEVTEAGVVSGLLNTSRTIGGALGLSLLVTVSADRTDALGGRSAGAHALTEGYGRAFLVGALVLALATVLVTLLPRPRVPAAGPLDATAQQGAGDVAEPDAAEVPDTAQGPGAVDAAGSATAEPATRPPGRPGA